jgi:hypothetical protein
VYPVSLGRRAFWRTRRCRSYDDLLRSTLDCHWGIVSTAVAAASDKRTLLLPMQPPSLIDMHQRDAWSPCPILRIVSTALEGATMTMMGATKFERFFRAAGGLDVDNQDLKRYSDFVNHKIYDLLVRGQATAKANGRDVIDPHDLPITKRLQECIHAFTKLGGEIDLKSIVDHINYCEAAARPGHQGRDGGKACRDRRRFERGACTRVQAHQSRHRESRNRGLGARRSDLRPAAIVRPMRMYGDG